MYIFENQAIQHIFYKLKSYVDTRIIRWKNKVARNEKRKKLREFSYSKNVTNFEAIR